MRCSRVLILAATLILLVAGPATAQRVIYVDTRAAGANDGSSWTDAFVVLHDALALARDGDEVWVAEGVYRPDQGAGVTLGDREASFAIMPGISLYGGFVGGEYSRPSTDWKIHATILSGDLLGNDTGEVDRDEPSRLDNSCHVVVMTETGNPVLLEGLHIMNGNARHCPSGVSAGAGLAIYQTPARLRDVYVGRNAGGIGAGIRQWGGSFGVPGGLWAERLELADNSGPSDGLEGGALYASQTNLDIRDSIFRRNQGGRGAVFSAWVGFVRLINVDFIQNDHGLTFSDVALTMIGGRVLGDTGGIGSPPFELEDYSTGLIVNSLIAGNQSGGAGALRLADSDLTLINSTIAQNSARAATTYPAILSCNQCSLRTVNSVLWTEMQSRPSFEVYGQSDLSFRNSIVHGALPPGAVDLGGTTDVDPMFADPFGEDGILGTEDDDYSLLGVSTGIDQGDDSALPPDSLDLDGDGDLTETLPTDLAGNPRVLGASVDMGAYEYDGVVDSVERDAPEHVALGAGQPYPNPFTGSLAVDVRLGGPGLLTVQVVDVLGRRVAAQSLRTGETIARVEFRTASWPPGVYFILIDGMRGRTVRAAIRTRE